MSPQKSCSELEEVITILYNGDQSGVKNGLKYDDFFRKTRDLILSEDHKSLERGIRLLQDELNKNVDDYVYIYQRASMSMMIAYASCKLEDQQQVLDYAKAATSSFLEYPDFWNKALAFWFLGIVYRNYNDLEKTQVILRTAQKFLEDHASIGPGKFHDETRNLCIKYIHKIDQVINDIPKDKGPKSILKRALGKRREVSPPKQAEPEPTPLKNNLFAGTRQRPQSTSNDEIRSPNHDVQESLRSPVSGLRTSSFHITIPVDVQALTNPQIASRALYTNLYEWLREYNRWRSDRTLKDDGNQGKQYRTTPKTKQFPIYGKATAGPRGEVTFEKLEWASAITEDNCVEFFRKKLKVHFIKDTQIKSRDGKMYGWLEVEGKSMNRAIPIPINDKDFVLFYKNEDMTYCENKIVIATQPGLDERYPLLIVKRLILDKESRSLQKYYLKSESSTNIANIPFTEENQFIGEVIAVAKPLK